MIERLLRTDGIPSEQHLGEPELHLDGDEMLLGAVMQVALEAAALLVLRGDEALPGSAELVEPRLQVCRQADISEHEPGLPGKVHEQVLFDRRQ